MRASQLFNADTLAAIGAAAAALVSMAATIIMYVQVRQSDKGRMSSICLEISRRYDQIYPELIRLSGSPIRWDEFHKTYPELKDKLASDEWILLRTAGGFFELVGAMVEDGLVDDRLLFKFMNIRPRIWLANEKTILMMRKRENSDNSELWIYWERLVKRYYGSTDERWWQQAHDRRSVAGGAPPTLPAEARRGVARGDDGIST